MALELFFVSARTNKKHHHHRVVSTIPLERLRRPLKTLAIWCAVCWQTANSNVPNMYWDFVVKRAALVNSMIMPSICDKTKKRFEAVTKLGCKSKLWSGAARRLFSCTFDGSDNSAREDWKLAPWNQSVVFLGFVQVLLKEETYMALKFR